jgi:predicted Zn-dependent peptidase
MRRVGLFAFAFLATAARTGVSFLEKPEPGIGRICVESVIKLPPLSPREWAALVVIKDMLPSGTQSYSRFDLLDYMTQAGDPLKVTLTADHLRIGYCIPKKNMRLASDLLRELVDKAVFEDDRLQKAIEEAPFRHSGGWEQALSPWQPDFSNLRKDEVVRVYRRVFRPEFTTIAVAGDFAEKEAIAEFKPRFDDWKPVDPGRIRILEGVPGTRLPRHPVTTTTVMASMEKPFATMLMTAFALGVGKGAAAFRVVRIDQGLSYRQEAVIAPLATGWQFGLIFQHAEEQPPAKYDALKEALKKDIDSWNAETVARAEGMISATLDLGLGALPVYIDPRRPLTTSLEDRTYWMAYSKMKLGAPIDYDNLRSQMKNVNADEMKAVAREWLDKAVFANVP